MCVCVHACKVICMCACMCAYIQVHMSVCVCACICACMCARACMHTYQTPPPPKYFLYSYTTLHRFRTHLAIIFIYWTLKFHRHLPFLSVLQAFPLGTIQVNLQPHPQAARTIITPIWQKSGSQWVKRKRLCLSPAYKGRKWAPETVNNAARDRDRDRHVQLQALSHS